MTMIKAVRPGGRSARVQRAVHQAVRDIQETEGRACLTVPAIAARACVTPSTIYRRWGDLSQLLSDVALEKLRPDSPPKDTGTFRTDMEAWLTQYLDEMANDFGKTILRDLLNQHEYENSGECVRCLKAQFDIMRQRAIARGEKTPTSDALIYHVFAPLIFELLFSTQTPDLSFACSMLDRVLREVS